MRTFLVLAIALSIAQYGRAQQGGRGGGGGRAQQQAAPAAPADPGFECFEHAETAEFPQSALRAHIDGTVYIRVQVTAQGTAGKIDTQVASAWADGPKLLTAAAEKAVRASKFKAECAGKTVAVVYRYDLHDEAIASPKPATRTESNIMFIDSQPATPVAAESRGPGK
jgi:Gram-negative bacterial TonB protein C-terminal